MGTKSKSKPSSEDEQGTTNANPNDSTDIFKLLFGREAAEEPGLGLEKSDANPTNADSNLLIDSKIKKNKRENHDSDLNVAEIAENSSKKKKKTKGGEEEKAQKLKRKEVLPETDIVEYSGEIKDSKKKKKKDSSTDDDGVIIEVAEKTVAEEVDDMKEKSNKKKKRKRDEIELAYEAKTHGVVANVESKKEVKVGEKRKSREDTAAMTDSKDDFDDETKLLRTIFVGNLPLKFKKKALLKEFTKFGEVESVRIRSVPLVDSKTPRKGAILKGKINEAVDSVNAYIVFKDEKSAQASLSHNMAMVGGNHIRVDKACPPRKKLKGDSSSAYDNQKTVFVGNLPFDVKDEEIYKLFCGLSQIESSVEAVRVIRDPTSSIGKGIAYVLFKTKEAANLVVRRRHLKIRDRDLRLYHAKPDTTPSKKRDLPSTDKSSSSSGKRFAVNPSSGSKSLSYQGLKATTKSIQKKEFKSKDGFRPRSQPHNHNNNSRPSTPSDVKERKNKRPAVAARKAKALRVAANTGGKGNGMKRKAENRTPDQRNKKPRFK